MMRLSVTLQAVMFCSRHDVKPCLALLHSHLTKSTKVNTGTKIIAALTFVF